MSAQRSLRSRLLAFAATGLVVGSAGCLPVTAASPSTGQGSEPLLAAWFTANSGRYARVVEQTGGQPVTTWPSTTSTSRGGGQSLPAYADVQRVAYSQDYVHGTPDAVGQALWLWDAVPTEGPTFDQSTAHQPANGEYHYHDNPLALRYQLGDNVTRDATGAYHEVATGQTHSPILGWAYDGYPIYGPYGY